MYKLLLSLALAILLSGNVYGEDDPLALLLGGDDPIETEDVVQDKPVEQTENAVVTTPKNEVQVKADVIEKEPIVTEDEVAELYVANFDRAPEADGLKYWVNDSKLPIEGIAESFYEQPETKEKYPTGYSTIDFVTEVYTNLFGREADQEGLDYWVNEIDSGSVSKGKFILAVVNGALAEDEVMMGKKRDAGLEFARSGSNDMDQARMVIQNITTSISNITNTTTTTTKTENTTTNTTTNTQDIKDSFNTNNNVNIAGTGNSIVIGNNINGDGNTVTGDTINI